MYANYHFWLNSTSHRTADECASLLYPTYLRPPSLHLEPEASKLDLIAQSVRRLNGIAIDGLISQLHESLDAIGR